MVRKGNGRGGQKGEKNWGEARGEGCYLEEGKHIEVRVTTKNMNEKN